MRPGLSGWILLTSGQTCNHRVREAVATYALVISLSYLGYFGCRTTWISSDVYKILERNLKDWYRIIVRGLQRLNKDNSSAVTALLFNNLFYLARSQEKIVHYPLCADDLTPLENMSLLGKLFEVTTSDPHIFGLCNTADIRSAIPKSRIFPQDRRPRGCDIMDGTEDLKDSLPIAMPFYLNVPAETYACCTYGELRSMNKFVRDHVFYAMKQPESVIYSFICSKLMIQVCILFTRPNVYLSDMERVVQG